MAKRGGLPKDTLFRRTASVESQEQDVDLSESKQITESANQETDTSPNKQVTNAQPKRQTYYVPEELHRQIKILAIEQGRNLSELVVEGLRHVVDKYTL